MRGNEGRLLPVPASILERTLGGTMRRAGYHTAWAGKTHVPKDLETQIKGTDYEFLTGSGREPCAEACVEFLRRPHERPFFLFASFVNPHDVCHMAINAFEAAGGPPGYKNVDSETCERVLDIARGSGDLDAFVRAHCPPLPDNYEPPEGESEAVDTRYAAPGTFRGFVRKNWGEREWRLHRWLYCRLTEMVDAEIGRVLDTLREAGLEGRTLVIFTSDHGDHDSQHRLEHKDVPYEAAARVPFVMRLPGRVPAGRVDRTHLVSNGIDLLPTCADYAGVAPPERMHGTSVRPVAECRAGVEWRDALFVESHAGRLVRTERFAYCVYESGARREMLFDMAADPGQMVNLAPRGEFAGELARHRALLAAWVDRIGDEIGRAYLVPAQCGQDAPASVCAR
jgi:arylsulfatase A-like enzyme